MNTTKQATLQLAAARSAFDEIATKVDSGELPATGLPDTIANIVSARRIYSEVEKLDDEINRISRDISQTETRATALQAEADKLKKTKSCEVNARMKPLCEDYAASAGTMFNHTPAQKQGNAKPKKAIFAKPV